MKVEYTIKLRKAIIVILLSFFTVNKFTTMGCLKYLLVSPCSLEMSGLYQNLEVSWTNLTFILMSG